MWRRPIQRTKKPAQGNAHLLGERVELPLPSDVSNNILGLKAKKYRLTTSKYKRPMLIQKLPHRTWITVIKVSRAAYPKRPAMNWPRPPQNATNGKKIVGDSSEPHHLAINVAVIHVDPANPANPKAAGGAIGCRNILTCGSCPRIRSYLTSWFDGTDIIWNKNKKSRTVYRVQNNEKFDIRGLWGDSYIKAMDKV